jgi:hypothetical protein
VTNCNKLLERRLLRIQLPDGIEEVSGSNFLSSTINTRLPQRFPANTGPAKRPPDDSDNHTDSRSHAKVALKTPSIVRAPLVSTGRSCLR